MDEKNSLPFLFFSFFVSFTFPRPLSSRFYICFVPSSLPLCGALSSRWLVSQQRLVFLFDTMATGFENNSIHAFVCVCVHTWTHTIKNEYLHARIKDWMHINENEHGMPTQLVTPTPTHIHAHSCGQLQESDFLKSLTLWQHFLKQ